MHAAHAPTGGAGLSSHSIRDIRLSHLIPAFSSGHEQYQLW